jgi:hypothetical protein
MAKHYIKQENTPFRLTPKDIQALTLIYNYRFITAKYLNALIEDNQRYINIRLRRLFDNSYIKRIKSKAKDKSIIYALQDKGISLLQKQEKFKSKIPKSHFNWLNKNVQNPHIEHTLIINKFLICLKKACQERNNIYLLDNQAIKKQLPSKYISRCNLINWHLRNILQFRYLSLTPDLTFCLKLSAKEKKFYFFVEVERTGTISSEKPYRKTYLKKMTAYYYSWKNNIFKRRFNFPNARVLTITTSQERVKNRLKACQQVKPSPFFLLTSINDFNLDNPLSIFAKIWQNPKNDQKISLID